MLYDNICSKTLSTNILLVSSTVLFIYQSSLHSRSSVTGFLPISFLFLGIFQLRYSDMRQSPSLLHLPSISHWLASSHIYNWGLSAKILSSPTHRFSFLPPGPNCSFLDSSQFGKRRLCWFCHWRTHPATTQLSSLESQAASTLHI